MDTKILSNLPFSPKEESGLRDSIKSTVRSLFLIAEPLSSEDMLHSFPVFVKWVAEMEAAGHLSAEEAVSVVKNFAGIIMEARLTERLSRQFPEPGQQRFSLYYEGFTEGLRKTWDVSPEQWAVRGKVE